jgi:predicted amidohydrolase
LLDQVVDAVISRVDWHPIDAIVFPGGFFRSPVYVGNRSHSERAVTLEVTDFGQAVMAAAYRLDAAHPGALIVVGIDSVPYSSDDHGDQLCAAFSPYGVIGIGRKVWPADGDTNWDGRPPVVCYPADFSSPHRIVTLANGSRALLCACYDVFGVAEAVIGPTARIRYIRYLAPNGRYDGADAGFVAARRRLVVEWGQLLADQQVDVALAAVHRFQQPGRDFFWQRHGLATASAALGGGLALGAAFFTDQLPDGRDRWSSPLAACGVPREHLGQGLHRPARRFGSFAALMINGHRNGKLCALVRLFDAGISQP